MALFTLLAIDQIKDLVVLKAFRTIWNAKQSEKDMREWEVRKDIPIAGWFLRKQLKPVSKAGELRNRVIVKSARRFVNTKTFETVVAYGIQRYGTTYQAFKKQGDPNKIVFPDKIQII